MQRLSTKLRFEQYVEISPRNCWLWSGDLDSRKIPRFYIEMNGAGMPRVMLAARYAWQEKHGLLHRTDILKKTCRFKKCVNPEHHIIIHKGGPNSRLTEVERNEIVDLFQVKKMAATLLAKEYGITRQQVYNILSAHGEKNGDRKLCPELSGADKNKR